MDYNLCVPFLFYLFIEPLLVESRHSDASMREWVASAGTLMNVISSDDIEGVGHWSVVVFLGSTSNFIWSDYILSRDCFMLRGSNGNEACHS